MGGGVLALLTLVLFKSQLYKVGALGKRADWAHTQLYQMMLWPGTNSFCLICWMKGELHGKSTLEAFIFFLWLRNWQLGSSVTKETFLTLLSCNYYCCFMLFSRSSRFVVFWSDTCNYGLLPLEVGSPSLCLVSCPLSLCQCPGSVFMRQGFDSPITRVLFCWGHSWEGLMGKGLFCIWLYYQGFKTVFCYQGELESFSKISLG